jgi:hypothetical protein
MKNIKRNTLRKRIDSMLDWRSTGKPSRESKLLIALVASLASLIVVSMALHRAWANERYLSQQISQLHQTK